MIASFRPKTSTLPISLMTAALLFIFGGPQPAALGEELFSAEQLGALLPELGCDQIRLTRKDDINLPSVVVDTSDHCNSADPAEREWKPQFAAVERDRKKGLTEFSDVWTMIAGKYCLFRIARAKLRPSEVVCLVGRKEYKEYLDSVFERNLLGKLPIHPGEGSWCAAATNTGSNEERKAVFRSLFGDDYATLDEPDVAAYHSRNGFIRFDDQDEYFFPITALHFTEDIDENTGSNETWPAWLMIVVYFGMPSSPRGDLDCDEQTLECSYPMGKAEEAPRKSVCLALEVPGP